jgi:osmoprotectant transport system substrate-binding protein
VLVACAPPRSSRIVIGAKNFTEQVVLGELLAQEIEAVSGQGSPGGAAVLSGGELSVPAGAGEWADRWVCGVHGDGADGDSEAAAAAGGERMRRGVCDGERLYERAVWVRVEPGLGFEDTFAMVVRGEDARGWG